MINLEQLDAFREAITEGLYDVAEVLAGAVDEVFAAIEEVFEIK